MTDLNTRIETAETRAECKMGMAKSRRHFQIRLAPEDARALGICGGLLNIDVAARQGTVDLFYASVDGDCREISDEASEPEAQARTVAHARRNPVGAALELLRIDLERRAT